MKRDRMPTYASEIVEIGRRMWTRQLCAGSDGNISVRLGTDEFLCTPSGQSKGFLSASDLCRIDQTGQMLGGRGVPSSEIRMHLAIYAAREDVRAVIHSHPPTATAFALAGREFTRNVYAEADVLLHPIALVPYVTPGDHRLAAAAAKKAVNSDVLLLANHGVVCLGTSLEGAYHRLEMLEAFAQILIASDRVGGPRRISPVLARELRALRTKLRGPRF